MIYSSKKLQHTMLKVLLLKVKKKQQKKTG